MAHPKSEKQIDRYNRFGRPAEWAAAALVGMGSGLTTFVQVVRQKTHDDAGYRQGLQAVETAKELALKTLNDQQIEASVKLYDTHFGGEKTLGDFIKVRDARNAALKEHASHWNKQNVEATAAAYTDAYELLVKTSPRQLAEVHASPAYKKLSANYVKEVSKTKSRYDRLIDHYNRDFFGIKSNGIAGAAEGLVKRFKASSFNTKFNIGWKSVAAFGAGFGVMTMIFNQLNTRDKLNEIDKAAERSDKKNDVLLAERGIAINEAELPHTRAARKPLPNFGTFGQKLATEREQHAQAPAPAQR